MRILLVGTGAGGLRVLKALLDSSHVVHAVVTTPPARAGIRTGMWYFAERRGIPTLPGKSVKQSRFAEDVRHSQVDLLLSVLSPYVVCEELLAAPRMGCYNLHPGPLPRYAGLNPVSWALYFGEQQHGVTLHQMVREVDAGPIVAQQLFSVEESDSAASVTAKCLQFGVPLVFALLDALEKNKRPDPIQNPGGEMARQFFGREVPQNGRLDWTLPAERVVNFVRACDFFPFSSPWGYPLTSFRGQSFGVVKALRTSRPTDQSPGTVKTLDQMPVLVAAADEWVEVRKIVKEGKYLPPGTLLRTGGRLVPT